MKKQDCEQLTFFPGDFRASHSPSPDTEEARMMTVTSGLKCCESFRKQGPLGWLVRTCLASSIWHSTRCLLTWKTQVTKSNRLLFRLAASTPRTKESECALWPTPSTGAALCAWTGNFKTLQKMAEKGLITEEERKELSKGNGGRTHPGLLEWLMGYEQKFTELMPTPTTTDYKGGCTTRYWRPGPHMRTALREREREKIRYDGLLRSFLELTPLGRIGPMNPEWVEWLMGFQIGRTALNASETP